MRKVFISLLFAIFAMVGTVTGSIFLTGCYSSQNAGGGTSQPPTESGDLNPTPEEPEKPGDGDDGIVPNRPDSEFNFTILNCLWTSSTSSTTSSASNNTDAAGSAGYNRLYWRTESGGGGNLTADNYSIYAASGINVEYSNGAQQALNFKYFHYDYYKTWTTYRRYAYIYQSAYDGYQYFGVTKSSSDNRQARTVNNTAYLYNENNITTSELTAKSGCTGYLTGTYYSIFRKVYKITYNANGGSGGPITQNTYAGIGYSLSSSKPVRAGYTFLGWSTSSTATSASYQPGASFSDSQSNTNRTLYAVWVINSYKITLDGNGGSPYSYNSNSWYTIGRNYMFSDRMTVNLLVTYKKDWNNGGSVSANLTALGNNSEHIISCTEDGGWNIESDGGYIQFSGYDSGYGYKVAKSTVRWTDWSGYDSDYFTMTFDGSYLRGYLNGVLIATSNRYSSGKIGYNSQNAIFVGAEAGGNQTSPTGQIFSGSISNLIIENSCWSSTQIQNYISNSTKPAIKYIKYGDTYGDWLNVAPYGKWGYDFVGYYTSASGGTHITTSTKMTTANDHTLYAHWSPTNYTLTANANGGSISSTSGWTGTGSSATKSVAYQSAYGTLPSVSRTGYIFNGWYTNSSGGSQVTSSTTMGIGNYTIYAQWTANKYNVSFDCNNTTTNVNLFNIDKTSINSSKISVSRTANDISFSVSATANVSDNQFSGFRIMRYNGDNLVEDKWLQSAGQYDVCTFTKENSTTHLIFKLNGNKMDYGLNVDISYLPNGTYTASCYLDTFSSSGGSFSKVKIESGSSRTEYTPYARQVTYNSTYGTLPTPTREGYTFNGWWTATSGGSQKISTSIVTTSDHTLYAKWTPSYVSAVNFQIMTKFKGTDSYVATNEGGKITQVDYKTNINNTPTAKSQSVSSYDSYVTVTNGSITKITNNVLTTHKLSFAQMPDGEFYLFKGISTTSSGPASEVTEVTPTTTSAMTVYVYYEEVSHNILRYDSEEKYFYFEDGEYPQTHADAPVKLNVNSSNPDMEATYDNQTNILTLNGSTTDYVMLSAIQMSFKEGEKYTLSVEKLSGTYSSEDWVFVVDVSTSATAWYGGELSSNRSVCETRDGKVTLTVNSDGEIQGRYLTFWIYKNATVRFENVKFKVTITPEKTEELNEKITTTTPVLYTLTYTTQEGDKEVPVYEYEGQKYAKVTKGNNTAWFKVEPIRWRVSGYGVEPTATPMGFDGAGVTKENFTVVSDKILGASVYTNQKTQEGWNSTSSEMWANINELNTTLIDRNATEYSAETSINVDRYSPTGTHEVIQKNTLNYNGIRVASEEEIKNAYADLRAKYTDFSAYILGKSSGANGEYWTRDLGNDLGEGHYVSFYGALNTSWLNKMQGLRFSMTMGEGARIDLQKETENLILGIDKDDSFENSNNMQINYNSSSKIYTLKNTKISDDPYATLLNQKVFLEQDKTYTMHLKVFNSKGEPIERVRVFYGINKAYSEVNMQWFIGESSRKFKVSETGEYRLRIDNEHSYDENDEIYITDFWIKETKETMQDYMSNSGKTVIEENGKYIVRIFPTSSSSNNVFKEGMEINLKVTAESFNKLTAIKVNDVALVEGKDYSIYMRENISILIYFKISSCPWIGQSSYVDFVFSQNLGSEISINNFYVVY